MSIVLICIAVLEMMFAGFDQRGTRWPAAIFAIACVAGAVGLELGCAQ